MKNYKNHGSTPELCLKSNCGHIPTNAESERLKLSSISSNGSLSQIYPLHLTQGETRVKWRTISDINLFLFDDRKSSVIIIVLWVPQTHFQKPTTSRNLVPDNHFVFREEALEIFLQKLILRS